MIDRIWNEYRRLIPSGAAPARALEVGALPDGRAILAAPELRQSRCVGVNITESGRHGDFVVMKADGRALPFANDIFDALYCSATLEHIVDFWRVLDEMIRVLRPGGELVVSVPGYDARGPGRRIRQLARQLHVPGDLRRTTRTMAVHDAPFDFYRFSPQAIESLLRARMADIEIWTIMRPPRIFGWARKPVAS